MFYTNILVQTWRCGSSSKPTAQGPTSACLSLGVVVLAHPRNLFRPQMFDHVWPCLTHTPRIIGGCHASQILGAWNSAQTRRGIIPDPNEVGLDSRAQDTFEAGHIQARSASGDRAGFLRYACDLGRWLMMTDVVTAPLPTWHVRHRKAHDVSLPGPSSTETEAQKQ